MTSAECSQCKRKYSIKVRECPFCGAANIHHKSRLPKKFYQKTSFTLIAAGLSIVIFFGFIHIITGVRTRTGFHLDIALKKSFGYRETIVDARKIASIPYVTAKIKYPLGCEVLQRLGYIDSGGAFEAAMKDRLLLKFKSWQSEFDDSINNTDRDWHDRLIGETENIDRSSRDTESYNSRGVIAAKNNEYETALSEFSRAVKKDPTYADAYYNRGLVYDALNNRENAISDFTKFIEISPQLSQGHISRGQIYLARGQYEQAISDFTRAIEISPKHAGAHFNRLLAFFALGEYDKVWDDVHKIETLGYTIPEELLGILYKISNR